MRLITTSTISAIVFFVIFGLLTSLADAQDLQYEEPLPAFPDDILKRSLYFGESGESPATFRGMRGLRGKRVPMIKGLRGKRTYHLV
ncbi:unnamed protein product [Caenorhabditis auriculariae]|uniref:Uncharacterized protein n=1 Tax=Caenorhabditis auriculariae TaxID=2777116 RepID=A0A8S1HYG7_9PELO|nr:unnamed protein product [Caenorhabditis auriculariae]